MELAIVLREIVAALLEADAPSGEASGPGE